MPLAILEACKGCIHECKIFSLDGAKLVYCPQYKAARLKRRESKELISSKLSRYKNTVTPPTT